MLRPPLPGAGPPGHRGLRHDPPGRAGAGGRVGRQGLPGPVGPAPRPGRGRRRAVPGPRDRRVQRRVRPLRPGLRRAPAGHAGGDRPARPVRLRHPDGRGGGPPGPVLGVRALQTASVQPGRPRRRLRRGRHRPQPRRRGGRAVRQRAALGSGLPGPAVSRPPGQPRLRPQGQAVGPAGRAGDGRLLRAARHRLHRGGVPDGGRQPAPRLQGGPQRHRGHLAGLQGGLLLRVPRPDGRPGSAPRRGGAGRPAPLPGLRGAHGQRAVRLLQARPASRRRPEPSGDQTTGPRGEGDREPPVRGRRTGPALRHQGAPLPGPAGRRAASSTPTPDRSRTTT